MAEESHQGGSRSRLLPVGPADWSDWSDQWAAKQRETARKRTPKENTAGVRCRCGEIMAPTYVHNSGTTEVLLACPHWGGAPWKDNAGHQYLLTTTPEHAATGCCDLREVRG